MIDTTLVGLVAAAAIIALILFGIMKFMPHSSGLNKEKYQSRWLDIEKNLDMKSQSSQHMAIMYADKLLDQALKESGSSGQTMGQRLKSREKAWSNVNSVWAAHKIRNQIAHEDNVTLNESIVRRALASFKQALKDLGAM